MKSTNKYKYKYIELQSQSVGIRGIHLIHAYIHSMQIITDTVFFNYMLAVLRLEQSNDLPKFPRVGELFYPGDHD